MKKYLLFLMVIYSVFISCHLYRTEDGRITNLKDTDSIYLANPSFEGYEPMGPYINPPVLLRVTDITGWGACSELGERKGFYKLSDDNYSSYAIQPKHGSHYLGMEVASDSTWDCVIQQLTQPIIADKTYKMSFWLASSKNYPHMVLRKGLMTDNKPVVMQIWGMNTQDKFSELLYATDSITNTEWKKYDIRFISTIDCDLILIKPIYTTEKEVYNGNILLDNLSKIEFIED